MWFHTSLIVGCCLVLCQLTWSQDWPEFRGSTGQGVYAGKLPVSWSEEKNIAWKTDLPGKGWSSPVIQGDKVYLTTAVPNADTGNYSLRCLCLETGKGQVLWNVEVFVQEASSPAIHSKNSHASATPIVTADRIYLHFGHQGSACLDLQGKLLWKNTEHRYKPVHGNGGSPCLAAGVLFFCCDGDDLQAVIGLDARTGTTRWKRLRETKPSRPFSFGTPLMIQVNGKQQAICVGSDVVMSLDPATGNEYWRFCFTGYSQIPRPLFAHGLLYVCTGFDSPKLLAIKPDGQGDVTDTHLAWQITRNVPNTPSPVIVDDSIYMVADNGVLSCLNAKTGETRWQGRLNGNFSASILTAEGVLYCLNEQGVCYVVETGKAFKEKAKNTITGQTLASPAACQGKIYLRTDERLYCIGK